MPVQVALAGRPGVRVREAFVRHAATAMLRALRLTRAQLSVVLCDDRRMRALNRRYRGLDRPTDVLAFALAEGEPLIARGPRMLGDVVLSVPTAARQAKAAGKALEAEVLLLLAHGLLHLLGYDHRTPDETRVMSARTDALVAAAGARPSRRTPPGRSAGRG